MTEISASADTLLRQASMTANTYLLEAIESIDNQLGKGYAAKNPGLIAAFMSTAAADFHTAVTSQQIRAGIEEAARTIADSVSGH